MERVDAGLNFVRYQIGALVLVALRDGYVDMPSSRLRQPGDRPFAQDLPPEVTLVDGKLRLSVNAFLVDEGNFRTLIDTGAGNAWDPTMGQLNLALAEAGVSRSDISAVAFTHTHVDHVSGLVAHDGSDAFPNLERVLVPSKEMSRFAGIERLSRFSREAVPVSDGLQVTGAITAREAAGHEVGHTMFELTNAGHTLLIWGDIVHAPSVQFARPDLSWEFDADQERARETRALVLARAARPDVFVAGAHLDFPGVGIVTREASAYAFVPL